VSKRGSAIIEVCNKSSSHSAANAICDHMHDWCFGSREGTAVSMGVISNGNTYGVPEDLIFSFPLDITSDGNWTARSYSLTDFQKGRLEASFKELLEERKIALDF
jgi:malate dehydrogenase